ncbi:hypothetical protein EVAR_72685_1 [Eumeta japonica]|uniref:Uncharacterized protein n=1 Tax=Eumeta variegata TaxID=151549 RepID=A0A4C1SED5_EUMVA|nr:hypothetical protein EVAR_72685_1 [Eumeta japonica]
MTREIPCAFPSRGAGADGRGLARRRALPANAFIDELSSGDLVVDPNAGTAPDFDSILLLISTISNMAWL